MTYVAFFPLPSVETRLTRNDRPSQDILNKKIAPYANKAIVEYLGDEEAELLNAVTQYLRDHKPPQELVDELEPVRPRPSHARAVL